MDFVRTEVRSESLAVLGLDAKTASALATSLVRGEFLSHCDYCGRPLYEADQPTFVHEWSMTLRETMLCVSCTQCLEGDEGE